MGQYHFWNILITMMQCIKLKHPLYYDQNASKMILSNGFKNKTSSNGRHVQDFIEMNCSFFNKEIMAHLRQNFYWRDLIFSSSSKIEKKQYYLVPKLFLKPEIYEIVEKNLRKISCYRTLYSTNMKKVHIYAQEKRLLLR